jgi:hypothetical protein
MSKKFSFEVVTHTTDQIAEMAMDEIQTNISKVKKIIREAQKLGQETMQHEVEYCYLDHERQMRMRNDNFSHQHNFNSQKGRR